jgi:la-related protein 4
MAPISDPEALKEAVRKQVEFYFSKDNLVNDPFLIKLMDSNQSAAISDIMKFAKLSALTAEETVVRESLVGSTVVVILGDRIKAVAKAGNRATIILREIPSDVPESEVRAIFDFESCKSIHSVRSDVGDTWFVVMESEEDAKDTILDLKLKKRVFRGASVKCRLKSEQSIPRSFYPAPSGGSPGKGPVAPGMNMGGMNMGGQQRFPYNNGGMPAPPMMQGGMMGNGFPMNPMGGNYQGGADGRQGGPDSGHGSPSKQGNAEHSPNGRHNSGEKGEGRKGKQSSSSAGNTERRGKQHPDSSSGAAAGAPAAGKVGNRKIEMNSSNFPPLAEGALPSVNPACNPLFAAIPVSKPGFKAPFHQYSYDEIISIVRGVQDATLPANDEKPSQYSQIMDSTPNLDLLHRQRTFSIDETREQLEQGRPVQREAVLGGPIDNTVSYSKKGVASSGSAQGQKAASKAKGESTLSASASSFSYASIVKTDAAPVPAAAPKPKPAAAPAAKTDAAPAAKKAEANKAGRKERDDGEAGAEKAQAGSAPSTPARDKKRREPKAEDAAAPAPAPSGWGGKATFANVSFSSV